MFLSIHPEKSKEMSKYLFIYSFFVNSAFSSTNTPVSLGAHIAKVPFSFSQPNPSQLWSGQGLFTKAIAPSLTCKCTVSKRVSTS